jgi:hypothetical protein
MMPCLNEEDTKERDQVEDESVDKDTIGVVRHEESGIPMAAVMVSSG